MLESDKYDKPHKSSPSEIPMRKVIDPQLQIDEQDIAAIRLDPKSRDDIPQILLGLQHIYIAPVLIMRPDITKRGSTGSLKK
ncbi:MAG: hypothetical protein KZQ60_17445 [Candidatus Thiodiazotropha sp. (ex Lucinoma aequizonata)]|nr:hypothetical protein [Candidatus Thiodiazotropha sp. (ex Lucinoma aequizonata)]MCU7895294.1 hypothetical protein [Candidatus Thiodiazotropha sp. (ex Lucinoma aequizonata)]